MLSHQKGRSLIYRLPNRDIRIIPSDFLDDIPGFEKSGFFFQQDMLATECIKFLHIAQVLNGVRE